MKNKINQCLYIIISILLIITLFPVFVLAQEEKEAKRVKAYIDYDAEITQISQVEEKADFIIKATILNDSKNVITGEVMGYTKTKLKVNKVYSGDMQEGINIYLSEPYYTITHSDGTLSEIFDDNYDKCEVGKEYIFFISKFENENLYGLRYGIMGRYPVLKETRGVKPDIDSLSNEDLDLWKDDTTTYREVYSEVLEKYN